MPFARINPVFGTLQVRLVLWITFVVVLMVFATMVVVQQMVSRALFYEFDQILIADAKEINLTLREVNDSIKLMLNSHAAGHVHQGWFVEIYDDSGLRLWATENTPQSLPEPDFVAERSGFTDADNFRMLLTRLPRTGLWLRLGSSKLPLLEDVALVNRVMILATLLIALVAPVGAYALAGRAIRPIAKIISTTARLQPQKLDERLPLRGTEDELDQLSRTINGMLDRIASYIERHRDFIANAAHELRSPLAAIRSTAEVALNRPRTTEEYHGLLTDVVVECSRLGHLVDRLMLLAEGDSGRLTVRPNAVSLDRLVAESVDMFHAVAESQGIELTVQDAQPVTVRGDEFHLRQIIRNLIDNAIKFTPAPGKVQLHVGVKPDSGFAYFDVTDTGSGIPPENLPRIFERFFRGDKSRNREAGPGGYGLGLSICQMIVRSLGGEISVQSAQGRGSTFTVTLPLGAGESGVG